MSVRRGLAVFNRTVANHFVGPVVTRHRAFGAVHHRGRKSGREYRTPVKVFRRGNDYVVALPYGATCDWARNVLAAGRCDLEIRGTRMPMAEPTVYADNGEARIAWFIRLALRRLGVTEFLWLKPAPVAGLAVARRPVADDLPRGA